MTRYKGFIVVIIGLSFIISVELYLYVTTIAQRARTPQTVCLAPSPTPFLIPQLKKAKTYSVPVKFPDLADQPGFEPAIHPEMIKDLATFIRSKQTSEKYFLHIENQGIVTEIDTKGKKVGKVVFPFGIKYQDGEINDWWYLSPQLAKVLTVTIEEGGESKKALLEDVNIGDKVILQQTNALAFSPYDSRHTTSFLIKILR